MSFLLLGVDSLIACFAVGSLVGRRLVAAVRRAAWDACDGGGFLLGTLFHWSMPDATANVVETAVFVGLGVYWLAIAVFSPRIVQTTLGLGASVRAEHRQHHLWSDRPRVVAFGGGPGHRTVRCPASLLSCDRASRERRRHARNPGNEAAEHGVHGGVGRRGADRRRTDPACRRLTDAADSSAGFWSAVARARVLARAPLTRRRPCDAARTAQWTPRAALDQVDDLGFPPGQHDRVGIQAVDGRGDSTLTGHVQHGQQPYARGGCRRAPNDDSSIRARWSVRRRDGASSKQDEPLGP